MAHRKPERNPLFAGRWFEDEIILLCLRWYFRFRLSYRDLVLILSERGLTIAHTADRQRFLVNTAVRTAISVDHAHSELAKWAFSPRKALNDLSGSPLDRPQKQQ